MVNPQHSHMRAEEALRLRERAIECLAHGVVISDPRRPGNPIIYANPALNATGYTAAELLAFSRRQIVEAKAIAKPFTSEELLWKVREALDSRPEAADSAQGSGSPARAPW